MALSEEFLQYVLDQYATWGGVTARKMFGGAGLYRDGKMFGLVADDLVYLKVDDSNRDEYLEAGSHAFQPYPDKPMTMSYYLLPPEVLQNPTILMDWSHRSLAIQLKTKKKKKK
ncbi:MAG: TfoX/Sxy family protein [Zavarzinella sp.]